MAPVRIRLLRRSPPGVVIPPVSDHGRGIRSHGVAVSGAGSSQRSGTRSPGHPLRDRSQSPGCLPRGRDRTHGAPRFARGRRGVRFAARLWPVDPPMRPVRFGASRAAAPIFMLCAAAATRTVPHHWPPTAVDLLAPVQVLLPPRTGNLQVRPPEPAADEHASRAASQKTRPPPRARVRPSFGRCHHGAPPGAPPNHRGASGDMQAGPLPAGSRPPGRSFCEVGLAVGISGHLLPVVHPPPSVCLRPAASPVPLCGGGQEQSLTSGTPCRYQPRNAPGIRRKKKNINAKKPQSAVPHGDEEVVDLLDPSMNRSPSIGLADPTFGVAGR